MDSIIERMSKRLAAQSSRRGFLTKMGKLLLGAAALVAGEALPQQAEAASLRCCTGTPCTNFDGSSGLAGVDNLVIPHQVEQKSSSCFLDKSHAKPFLHMAL
jgi:hypothetical protein